MARKVFFSFHYERDIWRTNVVRNSGIVEGTSAAGFHDASLWEEAKKKGDADVKKLIETTPHLRHYVTNIQTTVSGDTAQSRCFLMMTSTTKEGGTKIVIAGEYEDALVKRDGRWLFLRRKVHMDGA